MSDYTVESTLYFLFTTRQFSSGAPFTLASSPVISIYENDSATQITAGITLGVDHDGVTGLNLVTVVATGANGFESGKDYHLVITTNTVDSVSVVGEVVGRFTLGRSAAAVDLANGTDGLGAIKADTAATLVDTNELQTDWTNGGRLDLILDARSSQTSVDDLPTNAELATALGTADDAVLAAIAALNNLSAAQVASALATYAATQVAETYAANGIAPTRDQLMLAVHQHLMMFGINGTSRTVFELDGTTPAFVETLDDAVAATALTRA